MLPYPFHEKEYIVTITLIFFLFFHSELCWGKAVVAYTKPQQRRKKESKRLRREGDQIRSRLLIQQSKKEENE